MQEARRRWAIAIAMAVSLAAPVAGEAQNVRGFVFGEESGAPLGKVLIRLLTRELAPVDTTRSDALGRFSFRIGRPDRYVVVGELAGYVGAPQVIEVSPIALATVGVTISMKTAGEPVVSDAETRTAFVRGRVVEAGSDSGVEGAEVRVVATGHMVLTRYDGRFVLGEVPPGPTRISIKHIGFATREWATEVDAGSDYDFQIPVDQEAVPIEGIEVAVRSRAVARFLQPVFERMERGLGGIYLTSVDFKRRGNAPVAHMIQGLPSVQITGSGADYRLRFRRGIGPDMTPGCVPEIWVDGRRAMRAGDNPSEFMGMSTLEVEVIEVFLSASSIPPEYNTAAFCALGIWTKRGG